MTAARKQFIVGIGLIAIAVLAGVIGGFMIARNIYTDVPSQALHTIEPPRHVRLEAGEYQMWIDGSTIEGDTPSEKEGNAPEIEVFDAQNRRMPVEEPADLYITTYWPRGTVALPVSGDYLFITGTRHEILLTEPITPPVESESILRGATFIGVGVLAGLAGLGLLIAGLVGLNRERRDYYESEPPPDLRSRR